MSDKNNEKQLHLANTELKERIALLEKKLLENVRTGEALQDSEKRYRRLFESAKDGILILDAETGRVVDVNPFLLQLLGYSYEALYGQYIWELGVFKDIAASKDAFKTLQDNEYIRYDDLPLETLHGKPVAVEFVSNVYLVDHSKVIQCNIRDITPRKWAEKALEESEAKMRSILDNIGIGVALISPKMQVLELNRRMREWFPGVDTVQRPLCYRAFRSPEHDTACDNCPAQKTLQDGRVHEVTMKAPREGEVGDYRIISSPILDASGEVTAVIEMVEEDAVETPQERTEEIPLGSGETILLVEDEPALRTLIKMMLEKLEYQVLTAGIPSEAIRLAGEHVSEVRLLITDVVMPEMDGLDLAEQLQPLHPGMKILFMSGYTADVIAHRGVRDQGVNFIQKPFSLKDLAFKIRDAMRIS